MKLSIIITIAVLLLFCSPLNAQAERFNVNGYEISVSASQSSDTLKVSGRIMGGPSCGQLRLDIFCKSDKGDTGHIIANVRNVGGRGSRSISGSD